MGCAASSDTGTQYASLGHHGQQDVKQENNGTRNVTSQKQTTQQLQQPQQQQRQPQLQPHGNPPPYEEKKQAPADKPTEKKETVKPVAVKLTDVKSGLPDFSVKEYKPTDIGTYEIFLDFRTSALPFPTEDPPVIEGDIYTDHQFTVKIAFPKRSDVKWKRPRDVCDSPVLFAEGTTRFDIGQGEVGTCWFLAMVSTIADKPILLKRVIPEDAYKIDRDDYDGVFHCRFWRFGVWNDVYIDDHLPVDSEGGIIAAHSATDTNEMWVTLLEKGFAKLYGSYYQVEGGEATDSYMNLTGGVPESISFEKKKISPERLFSRLQNAFQSQTTMVECSVEEKNGGKMGLVGNHAYSMTGVYKVGSTMLVRIRNPFGTDEWKGPWSDGSKELKSNPSVPQPNKDDGEFYMDIKDFLTYFCECTICNLTPDFDRDGKADILSYVTNVYGNWREGKNGGLTDRMKNPMYSITLGEHDMDENGNVPLVVQLIQRQIDRIKDSTSIRCDLFKVLCQNDHALSMEELGDKLNLYLDEMQGTYRFLLEPGTYVALPSTSEAEDNKEFMIRFFTAGPVSNPCEVENKVVMTGRGRNGDEPNDTSRFGFTQCSIGAFQAGVNAGGQVSCEGFANNPQFLLTVKEEQTFMVEVMQPAQENGFAIGIKLFKADMFPANYDWLMENYDNAVLDNEGTDGPFELAASTDTRYSVAPGKYVLLIHCDTESDENDLSVAIYSERPIDMKSSNI